MSSGIQRNIDIIWGSIGIVYCTFGIFGNGFLAYVFLKLRRKQSVTDIIFLQLAVLDCLSGLAGLFGSVFLVNGRKWFSEDTIAADIICYPAGMMWNMASLTTPLLLSSASFGRFLAVYAPFAYEKFFNIRVVKCLIVYCWAHGLLGASISFAGPNKDVKPYQMFVDWGYCDQAIFDAYKHSDTARKLIYILLFTIPVILSCFSIIFCNLMVALKIAVMKHQYRRKKRVMSMALCSAAAASEDLYTVPMTTTSVPGGGQYTTSNNGSVLMGDGVNHSEEDYATRTTRNAMSATRSVRVSVQRQNSYSRATRTNPYIVNPETATSVTMATTISNTLNSINNTFKQWCSTTLRDNSTNTKSSVVNNADTNNFNNVISQDSITNNSVDDQNDSRAPVISLTIHKISSLSARKESRSITTAPGSNNNKSASSITASSPYRKTKRKDRQRRRRENQAILMTILLSINYLVCYIEIIHYYVAVSIGGNWEQSYTVVFSNVTYVYLWYYFSLFCAASNNCILQFCFNPNVKKRIARGSLSKTTVGESTNSG